MFTLVLIYLIRRDTIATNMALDLLNPLATRRDTTCSSRGCTWVNKLRRRWRASSLTLRSFSNAFSFAFMISLLSHVSLLPFFYPDCNTTFISYSLPCRAMRSASVEVKWDGTTVGNSCMALVVVFSTPWSIFFSSLFASCILT